MSEQYAVNGTPTIEVRVFRDGELIESQLCESDACRGGREVGRCRRRHRLVDDLSVHHTPNDVLAPEPAVPADEEYPHA